MRVFCLVVVLSLAAVPLRADPVALGRALFTGQGGGASDKAATQIARFACHNCHGRDARGGTEGDVPAIDARVLMRSTDRRPGYNRTAFVRAVTRGVDAAGRELSRLMPRYDLTEAEAHALFAYLGAVAAEQRSGVGPRSLRVGIPALDGFNSVDTQLRDAVRAGLTSALGGNTAYGRKVVVETIPADDRAAAMDFLVVISPRVDRVPLYTDAGIPVLHPLGALRGDEDPSILRSATPDRRSMRMALARELAAKRAQRIVIEPGTGAEAEDLAELLRQQNPAAPPQVVMGALHATDPGGDLVLLPDGVLPADGWDGRVWISWGRLRDGNVPQGLRGPVMTMIETPWIVSQALSQKTHPVVVHGHRAGVTLGEALKSSGRDVTRAGLLAALDDSVLSAWGLDYKAHRLTGTDRVDFVLLSGQ